MTSCDGKIKTSLVIIEFSAPDLVYMYYKTIFRQIDNEIHYKNKKGISNIIIKKKNGVT